MTRLRFSSAACALVLSAALLGPLPARADAAEEFMNKDNPVMSPADEDAQTRKPRLKAENQDETLPIEVALMYNKLLNKTPSYNDLIFSNQKLVEKSRGFGSQALMDQQREALKRIYDGFNTDTVMHAKRKVTLTAVNEEERTAKLDGMAPDLPLIYRVGDRDSYGVFLRNAGDVAELKPPYEFDNMRQLRRNLFVKNTSFEIELTYRPVVADTADFTLNDGNTVHVVVADIVEVVINDRINRLVLLKKRFKDWQPPAVREQEQQQSELLQPLP